MGLKSVKSSGDGKGKSDSVEDGFYDVLGGLIR